MLRSWGSGAPPFAGVEGHRGAHRFVLHLGGKGTLPGQLVLPAPYIQVFVDSLHGIVFRLGTGQGRAFEMGSDYVLYHGANARYFTARRGSRL